VRVLSLFFDESGDLGSYQPHSPYYILSMVIHDQSKDISVPLSHIRNTLMMRGLPQNHAIHTGPLIRREKDYEWLPISERRHIFRALFDFVRHCDIRYQGWTYDKRVHRDSSSILTEMEQALELYVRDHKELFQSPNRLIVYYDNGQSEITQLLKTAFRPLKNTEIRKVSPAEYSLFQAADMFCTIELLSRKMADQSLSSSERDFFSTPKSSAERALRKTYIEPLRQKRLP